MHSDRSGPPLVFMHFFSDTLLFICLLFAFPHKSSPATCFVFFLHNLPSYQSPFLAAPRIQPVCCCPVERSSTWAEVRFVLITRNFRGSSPLPHVGIAKTLRPLAAWAVRLSCDTGFVVRVYIGLLSNTRGRQDESVLLSLIIKWRNLVEGHGLD